MTENRILKSVARCFIILFFVTINPLITISSAYTLEENTTTEHKTENDKDVCTREIIECDKNNPCYVNEEDMEQDAILEQENISYDGEDRSNGKSLLGEYKGLTYYSQADSRWANILYTSTQNSSQTLKASGCGPTVAAMVVSSSKGVILPTTMANLFVEKGYRTKNSGTAWSAFPFIANYFDFKEYYTTSNLNKALEYLSKKNSDGTNKYYIVCSCGSGLFTSGGHYIVLTSLNDNTIKVYDPYQYIGKYNLVSRKAANVVISGNNVYVTKSNFAKYANYRNFWIFSNDSVESTNTNETTVEENLNYERYVATKSSNLNVRADSNINSNVISKIKKGDKVNVTEIKGEWSKINTPVNGWVSSVYLSSVLVKNQKEVSNNTNKYSTGKYITTSNLHVRSGAGTNYKIKKYTQLSVNARAQNKKLGNYLYSGYKKGVVCSITKIKGNWGLTKSGWICLDYCQKIY